MAVIERSFFAVTYYGEPVSRHPESEQIIHGRFGAVFSKGKVILIRTTLITMAFELDLPFVLFEQIFCIVVKGVSGRLAKYS